jgi:hypothetical protein
MWEGTMAKGRKRKKRLPLDTPTSEILRSLVLRIERDIEVLGRFKEDKRWTIENLKNGLNWLIFMENEKRNEEKRLNLGDINGFSDEEQSQNA